MSLPLLSRHQCLWFDFWTSLPLPPSPLANQKASECELSPGRHRPPPPSPPPRLYWSIFPKLLTELYIVKFRFHGLVFHAESVLPPITAFKSLYSMLNLCYSPPISALTSLNSMPNLCYSQSALSRSWIPCWISVTHRQSAAFFVVALLSSFYSSYLSCTFSIILQWKKVSLRWGTEKQGREIAARGQRSSSGIFSQEESKEEAGERQEGIVVASYGIPLWATVLVWNVPETHLWCCSVCSASVGKVSIWPVCSVVAVTSMSRDK